MIAARRAPWRIIIAMVALLAAPVALGQYTQNDCMQSALKKINELRAQHGASALEWDEALVAREMVWTTGLAKGGCPLWHSEGGAESLYSSIKDDADCAAAAQTWYDEEVKKYQFTDTPSKNALAEVGHFTQLVWRAATKVGCYKAVSQSGCIVIGCAYDVSNNWRDSVLKANVLPAGTPVTPLDPAPTEDYNTIACNYYGCRGSDFVSGLPMTRLCPQMCSEGVKQKRQAYLDEAAKLAAQLAANPLPAPQAADPTKIKIPVEPGRAYNREGYPYDYYVVESLQSAIAACEKDNGVGNCFRWDMTKVIPKCPPGYKEDRCLCLWDPITNNNPPADWGVAARKLRMM